MLPSVPATSVAHSLQANQRQATTQQVTPEAPTQDAAPLAPARFTPAGPTSSMELLDLSGQLRLGQSLSVFAETLGSLLRLPRHEGEALADYSKRLAAAINMLDTAERAKLQSQLNQIMKGATLRLLSELLNDPSGPAAARFAVQIEIAQYQEKDLAAGRAVSSYRQNNGNEAGYPPANANVADGARHKASSVADTAGSGFEAADGMPDNTDIRSDAASRLLKDNAAPAKAPDMPGGPDVADAHVDAEIKSTAERSTQHREPLREANGESFDNGPDGQTAKPNSLDAKGGIAISEPKAKTTEEPGNQLKMRLAMQPAENDATTASPAKGTAPDTPPLGRNNAISKTTGAIYDAATLIRRAHGEGALAGIQLSEAMVDLFVTEWISEALSKRPEARELRQVIAGQAGMPSTLNDAVMDAAVTEEGGLAIPQGPSRNTADDETVIVQPNALPMPAAAQTTTALAQQADTAFEKALLGMMLPTREPPAHPLVPNAGAQEFDDSQDHDIKRKPAVGDDGQPSRQGFGGGQFSQDGEQQPAEDDTLVETVLSQIEADASVELDMALPETGLRKAPRQHLSDHPATNAEDFYRRLASLE